MKKKKKNLIFQLSWFKHFMKNKEKLLLVYYQLV